MAGRGIRLFTDEDVTWRVAANLEHLGYDVESTKRAKRGAQRIPDYSQLKYAMQEGRAILTFNRADFEQLHHDWQARGWKHPGIIVSNQVPDLAELTRRVRLHLDTTDPPDQFNQVRELCT